MKIKYEYLIYQFLQSVYPNWVSARDICKELQIVEPKEIARYLMLMEVEKAPTGCNGSLLYRCNNNPSTTQIGVKKPVMIKELNKRFESIKECADYLQCPRNYLSNSIKRNTAVNGYHVVLL